MTLLSEQQIIRTMEPTYANDPTLTPSMEIEGGKEHFIVQLSVGEDTLYRPLEYCWQQDIDGIFVEVEFDPKIPIAASMMYVSGGTSNFLRFIETMWAEVKLQIQDRHSENIVQFKFKMI
jgi:hypothetical protein